MGSIVLDGASIGDEVLIGAGSVVPPGKSLPARTLWVGNPARQARVLTDCEVDSLRYTAAHYVRVKDAYRAPR